MSQKFERDLSEALKNIYRGLDLLHDELLQLSPKELAFLQFLEEVGQCRVKDLASRVNLPLSTVSWTADRMVQKKLMSRKTDSTDRRAIILSLSVSGRKALEKHRSIFDDIAKVAVTNLTAKEMKQAVTLIENVSTFFL